ncbi:MAG TPA: matrixin family metalloprotease [Candidatus Nitrosotalea sp.]|nr:matrixin family metalloprotease [Candidatus Nitrosotalea sp.]
MELDQQQSDRERSIKQLRLQLLSLTKELNKTTEQLQILELHETNLDKVFDDKISTEEIGELIRKQNKISHEIITIKKRIQKLSAKTILKTELIILPILAILIVYGISNHYQTNSSNMPDPIKTRYLIENLQGQADNTHKYWNIAKGTSLTVSIVNPDNISSEKINVIKQAILSTERIYVNNSSLVQSSPEEKSEYFEGWEGALNTIHNTKFYVPSQFNIVESNAGPGQIVIFLSHLEDPEGYSGYTRSVVDDSQILKSYITIYDADKITDSHLAAIVRHEFGHALGLSHTSNSQDLMHAVIQTDRPYISECDINELQSLYDGNISDSNFCNIQTHA